MKCIIFAGGQFEYTDFRDSADLVICADSGMKHAEKLNIVPDILIGDFDSYAGDIPENIEVIRSVPEKDDTDTLLAVKTAIKRGCTEIHLYGALGARFDHTYANIQTLVYALKNGCTMTVCDLENEITVRSAGEYYFPKREGWYFSLFAVTENAVIGKLDGVKYPLEDYEMTVDFPIGVSNEIISDNAHLLIKSGIVLIVRSMK